MVQSSTFTGRTIIVTGAGSGIGRATAVRLLGEGARVVGADVSVERLDALRAEASVDRLVTVAGDIADAATIQHIVDAAGPTIDGLANVAGIMDAFLPPAEVDDETWDRVFRVNVTAPMRLTRAVLPAMIERGQGAIVNVASEAALRASSAGAAYTASKHAIAGFTKSVAFFYGPQGIRANAVAPGAVATNIEAPMKSEYAAGRIGPIMQALMTPVATAEQLASAIVWLLSDQSANINGVVLPSDGGWSTI
ncbi:NAD(P)-dependent dehydrogenase (short-subunit alcohol dehydrogenase family) [Microbacterium sp. AG790]|uniref:SDR family NAD(P)-dependent oxidoreductase n=1 Tax=Microbacterium sp. AG790 TaxID=2183995 RepID=UPI000EB13203|nr:SDR family NAD(P)-dependent oxidoreductase [Microbacterium sp. AG790]RKS88504.1 NAD(P)-dependent dehydrogenase (short-subunit alcohol dehydrogenase family) [Microbacterium sp. AG790]